MQFRSLSDSLILKYVIAVVKLRESFRGTNPVGSRKEELTEGKRAENYKMRWNKGMN